MLKTQIIILLDIIFVIAFILVMKPEKSSLDIRLAEYAPIPYTKIIAIDQEKNKLVYDKDHWRTYNSKDDYVMKNSDHALYGGTRKIYESLNALDKDHYIIKTYVYGLVYNEIAKKYFDKCVINQECTSKVKISIDKFGKVIIE